MCFVHKTEKEIVNSNEKNFFESSVYIFISLPPCLLFLSFGLRPLLLYFEDSELKNFSV